MVTKEQILLYAIYGAELRSQQEMQTALDTSHELTASCNDVLEHLELAIEYMRDAAEMDGILNDELDFPA